MSNEDGSVWIVYNGEIYNFPELRSELQSKGHEFQTRSDTETVSMRTKNGDGKGLPA